MHPQSMDEYRARFGRNQLVTGLGPAGIVIHMPCPFCAAAHVLCYGLVCVNEALERGATCGECGRSFRVVVIDFAGGKSVEFYQTGGPDQPAWLEPKLRSTPDA
jgi:hypothetical protein